MATNKIGMIIEAGDWIVDRMDNNTMRKVSYFRGDNDESVYMDDGGVMGIDEIGRDDVFLPGEKDGYN